MPGGDVREDREDLRPRSGGCGEDLTPRSGGCTVQLQSARHAPQSSTYWW